MMLVKQLVTCINLLGTLQVALLVSAGYRVLVASKATSNLQTRVGTLFGFTSVTSKAAKLY